MQTSRRIGRTLALGLSLFFLAGAPVFADTGTSLGDRNGEGTTPFTGLAQSPEANLFTGAMTTSVTIEVPPGRKNMTPQLTLQYASSGGPGAFGFGWDLPIGRIERSTRWGVPRCTGPHTDDFVLILPSGAVELVAESATEYRPKVEQAYVRAVKDQPGNRWTVYDRAGLKYTFGDTDNARVGTSDPLVFMQPSPCNFTAIWALTKIEDPNGNTMEVTWSKDENTLYPATIRYGGNSAGLPHVYTVRFWPQDRPERDRLRSSRYGVESVMDQRIYFIEVSTDVPAPQTFIRAYLLLYRDNPPSEGPDGYQSLLSTIAATGQPIQTFAYTPSVAGYAEAVGIPRPAEAWDFLRVSTPELETKQTLLDMNGDGLLDLVRSDRTLPEYNMMWGVWFGFYDAATGSFGFDAEKTTWYLAAGGPAALYLRNTDTCGSDTCVEQDTFDITGDGIPDFVDATNSTTW